MIWLERTFASLLFVIVFFGVYDLFFGIPFSLKNRLRIPFRLVYLSVTYVSEEHFILNQLQPHLIIYLHPIHL